MHVLIVTHYFPPEIGAPQARLSEMGRAWQRAGARVTVLTGFPNHPTGIIPEEYRGLRYLEESRDGMRVIRTAVYATPNRGTLKKTLGHLSFMASGFFHRSPGCRRSTANASPFSASANFALLAWVERNTPQG